MKKEYLIKVGFQVPIKADIIGKELEKIHVKYGIIIPEQVVKEAKPKNSPLHTCFEWNDKAAAEKYREDQARYIIRAVDVIIIENDIISEPVKAFVHLTEIKEEGYLPICDIMEDKDLRQMLLQQAWKELESWTERYKNFNEFAEIIDRIKQLTII
jgi:hypothetical protein